MKLTKTKLKQIIKEEITKLNEKKETMYVSIEMDHTALGYRFNLKRLSRIVSPYLVSDITLKKGKGGFEMETSSKYHSLADALNALSKIKELTTSLKVK